MDYWQFQLILFSVSAILAGTFVTGLFFGAKNYKKYRKDFGIKMERTKCSCKLSYDPSGIGHPSVIKCKKHKKEK